MSASKYVPGFGSSVWQAPSVSGAAGTYVKIGQTKDIKGPDSEVGDIKITNNDSPGNSREYAAGGGLLEPGTIGWDMVFDAVMFTPVFTTLGDGNGYWWKEVFADGSTMVAPGYLKKAPIVTKTEDEADMVSVEVKLSGKPVFTSSGS